MARGAGFRHSHCIKINMSSINYLRIFGKSWKTIFVICIIGLIIALAFSFAQPLRYSSTVRLLVTQSLGNGVDPYTAIKYSEKQVSNIAQIVDTTSFFTSVLQKSQIDPSYFPTEDNQRRAKWSDTVDIVSDSGTGVMSVVAYHTDREIAKKLAQAVAEEIVIITPTYYQNSRAQIIDDALASRTIVKPNILKNAFLGILIGILVSVLVVLWGVKE